MIDIINGYAFKTAETLNADIFIAGDFAQAKEICRKWCFENGACVTVEPTNYIYTAGEEAGVRVGFINYARFPKAEHQILDRAEDLAFLLSDGLHQHSFSIVGPSVTRWYSRRPADFKPSK